LIFVEISSEHLEIISSIFKDFKLLEL
jgi:hypothetical protein